MPAPTVAASGPISTPFRALAQLLSQCETVQTVLEAADSTEAFNAINYPTWDTDDEDQAVFTPPLITISRVEGLGQAMRNGGAGNGQLLVTFILPLNETYRANSKDQLMTFTNQLGAIITEMFLLTGNQSEAGAFNLQVDEVNEFLMPQVSTPDTWADASGNPVLIAAYVFDWTL